MSKDLCGTRNYQNINGATRDRILQQLRESGATVTGNNPWDADTHNHGVKLRGNWRSDTETLSVIVTAKNIYGTCKRVWSELDKFIPKPQALPVEAAESMVFNFHEEEEEAV